MKLIAALALVLLVGCSTITPTQKKWTSVAVGVLVVGAIAAHQADNDPSASSSVGARQGCVGQPDGSCR
jgi:hypothetical protein